MMIEVNLLPAELRRVERTPLPRFLVIMVGTAVIMATGAFGVVVNWRTVPDLKAKESALTADITPSERQAEVYDKLVQGINETEIRKKAIAEVWRTRILWSEKLSQMAAMTPGFIGFKEVKLDEVRGGSRAEQESGGQLTIDSLCAGADMSFVADYRRIIQGQVRVPDEREPWLNKRFFRSFLDLLPTSTERVEVKDCVEKEALKFSLKMPLKTASVRLGEALQAAKDETSRRQGEERGRSSTVGEKTKGKLPASQPDTMGGKRGDGAKQAVPLPKKEESSVTKAPTPEGTMPEKTEIPGQGEDQGK